MADHVFPEFGRIIGPDAVQVDHAGMRLGAIADEIARFGAQIDRESQPV